MFIDWPRLNVQHSFVVERAARQRRALYLYHKEKKSHVLIFMVIIASGIAHGHIWATTVVVMVESCRMAVIVQLVG